MASKEEFENHCWADVMHLDEVLESLSLVKAA